MKDQETVDPVLKMLCGMVVFFTMVLFVAEKYFGNDAQIFQVVAGLLTGFGGALLMRVKPRGTDGASVNIDASAAKTVQSTQETTPQ